jgi:hypothetical protein
LLDEVLVLADDHRLDRTVALGGGVGVLRQAFLRLEGGLGTRIELDPGVLEVVMSLDGRRALRDVLAPLAATAPPEVDRGRWTAGAVAGAARLVELGLLVPA